MCRALGIDPGLASTGYALITAYKGELTILQSGVIVTAKRLGMTWTEDVADRCDELAQQITSLLGRTAPEVAAIEAFVGYHIRPGSGWGMTPAQQVQGAKAEQAVTQAVKSTGVPHALYQAPQWRRIVCRGERDKKTTRIWVQKWLRLQRPLSSHESDAAACALATIIEKGAHRAVRAV